VKHIKSVHTAVVAAATHLQEVVLSHAYLPLRLISLRPWPVKQYRSVMFSCILFSLLILGQTNHPSLLLCSCFTPFRHLCLASMSQDHTQAVQASISKLPCACTEWAIKNTPLDYAVFAAPTGLAKNGPVLKICSRLFSALSRV